ncbi:PREDICTED: protein-arginine deiminase type-2-like [Branchiostoma belcheri]|uniref:Protein-arginine deiminase type-2-like n=1 Tax=Branchiostoma belcheri TaxID=7741 RepID=A0A6P4XW46_BRABE|nr:PREDICTED: protein-arginine deiminase type-2-like [Branchiostoma belcheri]
MRPSLMESMLMLVLAGNAVLLLFSIFNMAAVPVKPRAGDIVKQSLASTERIETVIPCPVMAETASRTARWVTVNMGETVYDIALVGQHLSVDIRAEKVHEVYRVTPYYMTDKVNVTSGVVHDGKTTVIVYCRLPSIKADNELIAFEILDEAGRHVGSATLVLTVYQLSLDVDVDRDGSIDEENPSMAVDLKSQWKWGPGGSGAILLVNNDNDDLTTDKYPDNRNSAVDGDMDLRDMSPMTVRMRGPTSLPKEYVVWLHTSPENAQRIGIFHLEDRGSNPHHVIGPAAGNMAELDWQVSPTDDVMTSDFAVEALQYPDVHFDGEVSVHLSLRKGSGEPIFEDTVVFRVAPWIMTPNTLPPREVFVSEVLEPEENIQFIRDLQQLTTRAGVRLTIAAPGQNGGDRWMQNEVEVGYSKAPGRTPLPVAFSSPRYGGLQSFPRTTLLGPDFGYFNHYQLGEEPTSLDSFGNLEVSPPVKVNGVEYPLGRILVGSSSARGNPGRRMMDTLLNFLRAQRVQPPVLLHSDWLEVGHVDEFMTFVPATNGKGFRMLLSSPDVCYRILEGLRDRGFGEAALFQGKRRQSKSQLDHWDKSHDFSLEESATVTINSLLEDSSLRQQNALYQRHINENRDILKRELGLTEEDIVYLPQLYREVTEPTADTPGRAAAAFPNLVNMLVLGKFLGIPKPFGPVINGTCAFEQHVTSLLEPLGLDCSFLDDWYNYHVMLGEVHCGTQTRRQPFDFKWWEMDL